MRDDAVAVRAALTEAREEPVRGAATAAAYHLRRGIGAAVRERVNWIRLAARTPLTTTLDRRAQIGGANISLGKQTRIEEFVRIQAGPASRPGEFVRIGDQCSIRPYAHIYALGGSVTIGRRCSVNPYSVLYGTGGLVIGNFVRIAAHTVIVAAMHRFDVRDVPICEQGSDAKGITIEDDVWIGAGVSILDNVRIGTGAIVAAGAVVVRDVAPFTIVGGVPARVIGER
jgi:acetyltransferase-like isoleucine patch superfamily enzyme